MDKIKNKWKEQKFICVGLDQGEFEFNKAIIDQTFDLVCCYKLNSAFYEIKGSIGCEALKKTIQYIHQTYPEIPVILDAKRADVENTSQAYAKAEFDNLKADAVTVNPYLGQQALQPFLQRKDKGIFVLIKTSNPGAGEFQDLHVYPEHSRRGKPLYQVIAEHVAKEWNKNGNVGVVVGATYPEELKKVRAIVGDIPILIPGVGAQGGDLETAVKVSSDSQGTGMILNSSRSIIFAQNPREAALNLHQEIVKSLTNAKGKNG